MISLKSFAKVRTCSRSLGSTFALEVPVPVCLKQSFYKHLFVLYFSAPVSHSVNMLQSLTLDREGLSYSILATQLSV